ncbi:hypothetical protein CMO96_04720 [Candidatus Woesebacteria bacterium]|nr:hypothetical protein [Candidatus Woesebacteria bacterium]|tara:strand:+ start:445 stop:984 length:540 start_codon:yes stop_codon:yes gene_type:complete
MRSKGAVQIIIVVVLIIAALGGVIWYQTSRPASTGEESQKYSSPDGIATFTQPPGWEVKEHSDPAIKVLFAINGGDLKYIDEDFEGSPPTLAEYTTETMQDLSVIPEFKVIEQSDTSINGLKFHQLIYECFCNNQNLRALYVWTVKGNKAHGFAFRAVEEVYDELLPVAQATIDSITIQ